MDSINFVVAPDFAPQRIPCLQIFSTLLSKHSGVSVKQTLAMAPNEVTEAIEAGGVDLIYCNPFLGLELYEKYGYIPVLRPIGKEACDDVVLFTGADSPMNSPADVKPGMKATCPGNLGVKTVSMFMNKKLNLGLTFETSENLQQAIQKVRRGDADLGLYLHQTFDDLSNLARSQLKVLDKTDLTEMGYGVIRRVLMMNPKEKEKMDLTIKVVLGFKGHPDAGEMLEKLRVKEGFEAITPEMAGPTIEKLKEIAAIANG